MSWYELHRCAYDWVRATESGGSFEASDYDLTGAERSAFDARDIGALYGLGLHPVLLNRVARQAGYSRDDYRALLQPYATATTRRGRWQSSSS